LAYCTVFWSTAWLAPAPALAQAPGSDDPNNWPQYHRTANGWRYSPLDQIDKNNVHGLHVAWIYQAGDISGGMQETPIVIDGIIYSITAGNRVAAIDGKSGTEIWHSEIKLNSLSTKSLVPPFSRGVTVGRGKVFVGTVDGRAFAFDQRTGKPLWTSQLTHFRECGGCGFDSPPVLADDVLTFGTEASEISTSGKIFGVNADTGEPLWTFDVIKNDADSWSTEEGARYGGGGAWLPGSYDAETDTVFYGTSNPAADLWGEDRKGDNLYTDSVIALEPKTGKLKWYRQEIKHDLWDFDSAYELLFIRNNDKDLIVHLNKNGFVYVMDKRDGKLENVWRLVENYTFAKGVDPHTGEMMDRNDPIPDKQYLFCPSAWGARSWNHGAFNPKVGLWFTNTLELCMTGTPVEQKANPHEYSVLRMGARDITPKKIEGMAPSRLDARDPITGERKWTYEMNVPALGSVLTTGGGLVFNGDPLGTVRAFDADNGKVLWSFNTGSGLRSGIVSYAIEGKQYILVPSGRGSFAAALLPGVFPEMADVRGAATLIAFSLD
jgi:alcohol dehydrogenase (cytochrome c)